MADARTREEAGPLILPELTGGAGVDAVPAVCQGKSSIITDMTLQEVTLMAPTIEEKLVNATKYPSPARKDWRIGCIGSGFIMADCHLVSYRNAGFNPVAIASRTPAHAQAVA